MWYFVNNLLGIGTPTTRGPNTKRASEYWLCAMEQTQQRPTPLRNITTLVVQAF